MIKPLRVRDFMVTNLHVVNPDTEIMKAVQGLVDNNISGLLVVDQDGQLAGILTERDCINVALQAGYFDEGGGRVRHFMTPEVKTVEADTALMDIAEAFANNSFRRFPVVENGKLVGLIARRDILRAFTCGAWFAAPDTERRR